MVQAVTQPDYFAGFQRARADKRAERQLDTDEKFRGLQMEKLEEEIAREKRKETKAANVAKMTSDIFGMTGPAREQGMNRLFAADPAAGKGMQAFQGERTTQKNAEQDRYREELERRLGVSVDQLETLSPEEQQVAAAGIIDTAVHGGIIDKEQGVAGWDVAKSGDMNSFTEQANKILGRPGPKAGAVKTFRNTQTNEVKRLDDTDYTDQQEIKDLGPEWIKEPSKTETATSEGFIEDKVSRRKDELAEIGTKNSIATINDIQDLLKDNPEANTMVARVAGAVNDLAAEARAAFGIAGEDPDLWGYESYEDTFKELGIDNAEMKSMISDLGYTIARSRESGQLSKADVRSAIITMGGNIAHAPTFNRVLQSYAKRLDREYRTGYNVRTKSKQVPEGLEYTGDLGLRPGADDAPAPIETKRKFQGKTWLFKGGENIKENWVPVDG